MSKKSTIQQEFKLPTLGKFYTKEDKIPETLILRPMNASDEKLRLSSSRGSLVLPELIKRCTINIEDDSKFEKMKLVDLYYVMYKLRSLTYGSNYPVEVKCRNCGRTKKIEINIDELPVNFMDTNNDNLIFELSQLPISGDILGYTLLSAEDQNQIEFECERILSKSNNYEGDPEFIVKWCFQITTINGKELSFRDKYDYFSNMHAKDFRFMESRYEEAVNGIGIDLAITDNCDHCGNELNFILPLTSEFFRPKL